MYVILRLCSYTLRDTLNVRNQVVDSRDYYIFEPLADISILLLQGLLFKILRTAALGCDNLLLLVLIVLIYLIELLCLIIGCSIVICNRLE